MKVLLLGANGFIGSHLSEAILRKTDWTLDAFDLHDYNLTAYKNNPSFSFTQGDLFKEDAWLEDHVREADVVLPFAGIASQKNSINFYHMGIYAIPELLEWFVNEYPKHSKQKLDMGKSCIRFKKPDNIPFELIGELVKKITVQDWIATYESAFKK